MIMITNQIEELSDNKFLYDLKRSNMKLIVISQSMHALTTHNPSIL